MDGSKSENGVGSEIAISIDKHLTFQMKYKLAEKCSNNQAEQLANSEVLEKMKDLHQFQGNQRSVAIHTDSRVALDAIANPRNHQNLVEQIKKEIRRLENDTWNIHLTWVKAHDNYGNELADRLAKEAACSSDVEIAYLKTLKNTVTSELKEIALQVWQREWDASHKGELTKTFFPTVKDRISKRLQMCTNLSTTVTRHSKLRSTFIDLRS
jgi:ribonuclease HI